MGKNVFRGMDMKYILWIVLSCCVMLAGCSSVHEAEPEGLIARFGGTPAIDGVIEPGEWDDAEIVRTDQVEQFRVKHDGVNLYFAVRAGGGNLLFNTESGVRVLHWSSQLGSARYVKSESGGQSLDKPFEFELWRLHQEPAAVIRETLDRYLARNGWVGNTASMGELMQSEIAVSFEWLGIQTESRRFIEIPGVRIAAGLMISRGDPREDQLRELSREKLMELYPFVYWPKSSPPMDAIGMSGLPKKIRVDPSDFGGIWVDLRR